MAKKYKLGGWQGKLHSDKDAEVVGVELERLFPDGQFTPHDVVKAASKAHSPLHKYFEWDDAKAAYEWRLKEARAIIRAVIIVEGDAEVPQFHNVEIKGASSYVSTAKARRTPALWKQVLEGAMDEAVRWSERYKNLKQLTPIHSAIEATTRRLYAKKERTETRRAEK